MNNVRMLLRPNYKASGEETGQILACSARQVLCSIKAKNRTKTAMRDVLFKQITPRQNLIGMFILIRLSLLTDNIEYFTNEHRRKSTPT